MGDFLRFCRELPAWRIGIGRRGGWTPAALMALGLIFSGPSRGGAETRHFIIGYVGDSGPADRAGYYVAPISDPEQISRARKAIEAYRAGGPAEVRRQWLEEGLAWRVLALCDYYADGVNRDYSRPGAPLWNWHVDRVLEISSADFLLIGLNGYPWAMEFRLAGFSHRSGLYQIGFFDFGPIGELPFPYERADAFGVKTSWIGDFRDHRYPWIDHDRLGWLWVHGFDPENVWLFSIKRGGWVYTAESVFPWVWDAPRATWRYWLRTESGDWFFDALSQKWEQTF
jgi:hypothetical protein